MAFWVALALGSLDDEDGVVVVVAAVELACLGVATSDGSVILFSFATLHAPP